MKTPDAPKTFAVYQTNPIFDARDGMTGTYDALVKTFASERKARLFVDACYENGSADDDAPVFVSIDGGATAIPISDEVREPRPACDDLPF